MFKTLKRLIGIRQSTPQTNQSNENPVFRHFSFEITFTDGNTARRIQGYRDIGERTVIYAAEPFWNTTFDVGGTIYPAHSIVKVRMLEEVTQQLIA